MAAIIIALLIIGVLILWLIRPGLNDQDPSSLATFTVQKGALTISVTESGTIKPRDQIILKNEVEGKTSILWLIQEGTVVKEGDLLVELDTSQLIDERINQQIAVQNSEAAYIGARENLEVIKNQAQSDLDNARLQLDFARQDLKKYIEGEYPNALKEAEARITLAKEELGRAEETVRWSKRLFNEKYISQAELQADELVLKTKELELELAESSLDLLKNYTHKKRLAELESNLKQAEMSLERTTRKARANVIQEEADLKARESQFRRQKDKLEKIERQIEKTSIYAPVNGIVIYATSARSGGRFRRTEPLAEGQAVQERQELIHLPTTSSLKAEIGVHESSMEKIKKGMPVKVTVDALPDRIFSGTVDMIAPLPDADSAWMNPDLKIYNTVIFLDGNSDLLRTGMTCRAEIIIEQYDHAVYIPIQAVLRVGGEPTVYVVDGKAVKPRRVETGMDNNRMIRIISGLKEGEVVLLTPPLESAAVDKTRGRSVPDPMQKSQEGFNQLPPEKTRDRGK
ncbi:efflux RND transporter periplasmic adaptor subunit [bacterium]|nr:efflux RND transporter periplasmic adaptor subunit [bacterium]